MTGNILKIIAAIAMVTDHVGLMFFPQNLLLRIIGRLAFPIFAFMIAEGCHYTRNRRRHFGQLFGLAVACQIVYFLAAGDLYLSILFTFSLSVLTIYALQFCKAKPGPLSGLVFAATVATVYVLNQVVEIDYGFWGCMAPVFAAILRDTKFYTLRRSVTMLGIGLVFLALATGGIQIFALAALPLLYCYSGQRGKVKMKYFFYIFYPAHLALLQLVAWFWA